MIEPVVLRKGGRGKSTLTLYGAMVLEDIIWADAYDGSRAFKLDEILHHDGKSWRLLTPAKQYFQSREIYEQFDKETDSEVLLEWCG